MYEFDGLAFLKLFFLLQDRDFKEALEGVDNGWVFATHGTGEFPHFQGDFPCVPPWLREMLNYKLRDSRLGVGELDVTISFLYNLSFYQRFI